MSESTSWNVTNFDYNEAWYAGPEGFSFGADMVAGESFQLRSTGCVACHGARLTATPAAKIVGNCRHLELNNWDFLGNFVAGLGIANTITLGRLNNCTFSGTTTIATAVGIQVNTQAASGSGFLYLNSCTLGAAAGVRTSHTTGDISITSPTSATLKIIANNTTFASSTVFDGLTHAAQQATVSHIDGGGSYIKAQRFGGTQGDHRTYLPQGVISRDASIYRTLSPSERLTPNSSTYKLHGSPGHTPVANGGFTTIKVWIRKSAAGDGAAYTGNQPRLMLSRTDALGVTSDQVLATASGSTGTWEQLSGITPTATDDGIYQFYIDCDGTAGWINVDDWSQ